MRVTIDKAVSPRNLAFPRTVRRYEVLEVSGKVVFSEDFPTESFEAGFDPGITLDAYRLQGADRDGIILIREAEPSAPLSGRSFRVFGRRGAGLEPFSRWLTVYGSIHRLPSTEPRTLRLLRGDVIMVSVWTGWFGVVVPVTVDLARGAVSVPAGARSYPVETGAPDLDNDLGEARLFSAPSPGAGFVPIRVTRASRIEYLEVLAAASLAGEGSWREVELDETPWLRIRVDGKEGWVREPEDLIAVGLRQAG